MVDQADSSALGEMNYGAAGARATDPLCCDCTASMDLPDPSARHGRRRDEPTCPSARRRPSTTLARRSGIVALLLGLWLPLSSITSASAQQDFGEPPPNSYSSQSPPTILASGAG